MELEGGVGGDVYFAGETVVLERKHFQEVEVGLE